jgi:hypothetical protein
LVEHKYYCGDCGKELTINEKPCSACGSPKRRIEVTVTESITVRPSLKGTVKDSKGWKKTKLYVRNKVSKHGKEAKEVLKIDKEANRKYHHVEEQNSDGSWTTVHHEDEPLKEEKEN